MPAPVRVLLLLLACALAGCSDYPRDAEDSTQRVRGSALRAGVSHDPPFVVLVPGREPSGSEVDVVRALARTQDAPVEWVVAGHDTLMRDLLAFRLHVVAGGHTADSPWTPRLSWSREFQLTDARGGLVQRRLALPPGENAWQLEVDRYIHRYAPSMARAAGAAK